MSHNSKINNDLTFSAKVSALSKMNAIYLQFGNAGFAAIRKNYLYQGYITGFERLSELIKEEKWDRAGFLNEPVGGIKVFLQGYFEDRGRNMPEIWIEDNTIFLKTPACHKCVTVEAEKQERTAHPEICFVYCRATIEGMLRIFETLFPGLVINYYNVSSRRQSSDTDCVEAFQIIYP